MGTKKDFEDYIMSKLTGLSPGDRKTFVKRVKTRAPRLRQRLGKRLSSDLAFKNDTKPKATQNTAAKKAFFGVNTYYTHNYCLSAGRKPKQAILTALLNHKENSDIMLPVKPMPTEAQSPTD